MKKYLLLLLPFCLFTMHIYAQTDFFNVDFVREGMGYKDSVRIIQTKQLEVPEIYKKGLLNLPAVVDNSTKPFFRPITWQSGYECGQTAGIAFVFTYEIDRLRNLNASLPQNQYHTHFSWNFLNDGYNYNGVSFFDTWEITRTCGNPNIADYGALYAVSEKYWLTDYTKYYNGMKNRINDVYSIRCDSPEGINSLKGWLYDHLEGSPNGGIAAFYGQYCGPDATLPAGTPEAGKALISTWGTSPSHAWTVAGYNDSIRYDYNNDGQYTNHIDINGDGIVNVRDWEIGGIKIANGYSGTGWGNGGFSYVMYKSLADGANNGIWNASVYVVQAKETYEPKLTMKIGLKHNIRNQIKVIAGVSQNIADTRPEIRLELPIFNYHGGPYYMRGDSTEAGKNLEFGLDVTPLLSYLNSGQQAKFFLEVVEKDPNGTGIGQINSFSLIDYNFGTNESIFPQQNIPLNNNDTTRLAITKNMIFNAPLITTDSILAKINADNATQLNAQSGTQPYMWRLKMDYNETTTNNPFPTTPSQILNTGNSSYVIQNLPFDFPFFGEAYNKIYIYADGFIKFDNNIYNFPYLIDADLLFKSHKMIAPFHADLVYGTGKNVTFETTLNSATIVWNARISGQPTSNVNVALKIYDNGKIEFFYGNINLSSAWRSAVSGGDVVNFYTTGLSNSFTNNTVSKKVELIPPDYPVEMNLSESGMFTSKPHRHHNTYIKFCATDNNNIFNIKNVLYKTYGLVVDYTINAGGDTIVHAGDTVQVSVKIKNMGALLASSSNMIFNTIDTNVVMLDTTAFVGSIANGDSVMLNNAFSFVVKNNAHDGHFIDFLGNIISLQDTFTSELSLRINTFLITTGIVSIADGNNNILEPNETAALMLEIKNIGGAAATNLTISLSTTDSYIVLNPASAFIDTLLPGASKNAFFIITTAANTPSEHLIVINAHITSNNNFSFNTFFFIQMGHVMEDFETNDFSKYDWVSSGNLNWFITDSVKYQGNYSARSGLIMDNQASHLSVNQYVLADGFVKFHRKVSCEKDNANQNYDYLAFYIDGAEKARWDGDMNWAQVSFPVQAGNRTYKWSYVKDFSVSTGADCAWIDNIIFPISGDPAPDMMYNPTAIYKTIQLNTVDTAIVHLYNAGNYLVLFSNHLQLINNNPVPWATALTTAGGINGGETQQLTLQFDATQLQIGNYDCQLVFTENFLTQTFIPVYLTVENQASIQEHELFSASCYPNPFNNHVNIALNLNEYALVNIDIYDFTGRKVNNLMHHKYMPKGAHHLTWDGTNFNGHKLSDGIYLCTISINNSNATYRLILSR